MLQQPVETAIGLAMILTAGWSLAVLFNDHSRMSGVFKGGPRSLFQEISGFSKTPNFLVVPT